MSCTHLCLKHFPLHEYLTSRVVSCEQMFFLTRVYLNFFPKFLSCLTNLKLTHSVPPPSPRKYNPIRTIYRPYSAAVYIVCRSPTMEARQQVCSCGIPTRITLKTNFVGIFCGSSGLDSPESEPLGTQGMCQLLKKHFELTEVWIRACSFYNLSHRYKHSACQPKYCTCQLVTICQLSF